MTIANHPHSLLLRRSALGVGTLLLMAASLFGCATTPSLTLDEVTTKFPAIAGLQEDVQKARAREAEMLAPEGYASVSENLKMAIDAAKVGNVAQANSMASAGAKGLLKVNKDIDESRDLLGEVLTVRARAERAGASHIYAERTAKLEESLRETCALIERGKLDEAKQKRQTLIDGYSKLELAALKEGVVEVAKATIKEAETDGAKKYSPKTFEAANAEMKLARSILDADRTDTEKANVHAHKAKYLAEQSSAITELIKDMDRREFDREQTVLWYQSQLTQAYEPVGTELRFDRANRDVIAEMKDAYAQLILQRDEVSAEQVVQTAVMQQQIALTEEELLAKKLRNKQERERFEAAQSMFTPAEATAYRQIENVLISAHGFSFPPGQSQINSDNFVLLNKIAKVIALFPGSKIQISGHTDSTGTAELNLRLSKERAENVAKFLNEVGGIALSRLSWDGFGSERPVATNQTADGRALNRRVEVLIVNPGPVSDH